METDDELHLNLSGGQLQSIIDFKTLVINESCLIDDTTRKYCNEIECKIVRIAAKNDLSDILEKFRALTFMNFPKWFILIIEAENFGFNGANLQELDFNIKELAQLLNNRLNYRPMIIQLTSKSEKITKFLLKKQNLEIIEYSKKIDTVENFSTFLWIFLHRVNDKNFGWSSLTIDESFLKIKDAHLIIRFLQIFIAPDNYWKFAAIQCAKKGSLQQLLAIFDDPFENHGKNLSTDVQRFLSEILPNSNSESFISIALENSIDEIPRYLINTCTHLIQLLPFDHQVQISTEEDRRSKFLCDLLEIADYPFPENFNPHNVSDQKLIQICEKRQIFFEAIKNKDLASIDDYASGNQNLKIVYNFTNSSALKHAIDCNNVNIYIHLKYKLGFRAAPSDNFDENLFDDLHKAQITRFNICNSLAEENSVLRLVAKSLIYNRNINKETEQNYRQLIKKWYQEINIYEVGSQLINVVAQCEDLKIIFDFECSFVSNADRLSSKFFLGSTHADKKWIFIGSKVEKNNESWIKGIIVHEFCHYALNLVFQNNLKPYYENHKMIAELFDQIVKYVRSLMGQASNFTNQAISDGCNGIIFGVFINYLPERFHQELIVTVPQNKVQFYDNSNVLQNITEIYKCLFIFYELFVTPLLKSFNIKRYDIVRKFNRSREILTKIWNLPYNLREWKLLSDNFMTGNVIISTNIPKLLLRNICYNFFDSYKHLHDAKAVYLAPKALETKENKEDFQIILRENINLSNHDEYELLENFHKETNNIWRAKLSPYNSKKSSNFNVIVDCTKASEDHLKIFSDCLGAQNINFTFVIPKEKKELISCLNISKTTMEDFKWNDLDESSQNMFLQKKINFQQNPSFTLLQLLANDFGAMQPSTSNHIMQSQVYYDEIFDSSLLNLIIEEHQIFVNEAFHQDLNADNVFHLIFKPRKFIKTSITERTLSIKQYEILENTKRFKEISRDDLTVTVFDLNDKTYTEISLESQLLEVKDKKYVLISDIAGTGKSWMLKKVAYRLWHMYPKRWITFVDLKKLITAFKSHLGDINFVDFTIENILKPKAQNFEIEIFKQLYKNGKVTILFDGFDEISPDCAEIGTKLFASFEQNQSNQLWITTRDYFEVDLQEKLSINDSYKLDEFKEEYGIDIIVSKWILQKYCPNIKHQSENYLRNMIANSPDYENFKRIITNLVNLIPKAESKKIGYPQFYRIIAEILNVDITGAITLTLYIIFKKYNQKQFELWSRYQGKIREQASIEIPENGMTSVQLHQYHAMKNFFSDVSNFCDLKQNNIGWSDNHIKGFGFLIKINNIFMFPHKTFCDFFAAEFFLRILHNNLWEDYESFFTFLKDVLTTTNFNIVRMFINEGFEPNDISSRMEEKLEAFSVKFFHFFGETTEIYFFYKEKLNQLANFFLSILNSKNADRTKVNNILVYNVVKIVNVSEDSELYGKYQNFITDYQKPNELESLIKKSNIFHALAGSSLDSKLASELINKSEEKLGKKFIYETLQKKHEGLNLLLSVVFSKKFSEQNFKNYFNILQGYLDKKEIWEMVCEPNILELCMSRNDERIFKSVWSTVQEFSTNHMEEKTFHEFLFSKDFTNGERTFLFSAVFYNNINFYRILWELLAETFHDREDLKKFVLEKDNKDNNFIHMLVSYGDPHIIVITFEMLQGYLSSSQYSEIVTSKGFNNRNILLKAADISKHVETCRVLWTIFENFFVSNQSFLEFLNETDTYNCNVIFVAANFSTKEVLKFIVEKIEAIASVEEIKNLLNKKTSFNRNLLQSAMSLNSSFEIHVFLWKIMHKYFSINELSIMITETDNTGLNLLKLAEKFKTHLIEYTRHKIQEVIPSENI